ncbi:MAG: alpha/beta hydrolase, partial [Pseudomonadota bacterium]|nr:alpha/beta hydrolase [Pseudomonadota bacterium]
AIKWLNKKDVNNNQIILYGESLGTGVAVEMAKINDFNGIILESPFTSIENSAKIYYPYLPVKYLLKDRYDTISKIKMVESPIMIMHGEKDDVVPFSMGKELFEKANSPKQSYFTPDDDHMMEFNSSLLKNIKDFIEKY